MRGVLEVCSMQRELAIVLPALFPRGEIQQPSRYPFTRIHPGLGLTVMRIGYRYGATGDISSRLVLRVRSAREARSSSAAARLICETSVSSPKLDRRRRSSNGRPRTKCRPNSCHAWSGLGVRARARVGLMLGGSFLYLSIYLDLAEGLEQAACRARIT